MTQAEFEKIKDLRCILIHARGHVLASEDGRVWELVDESYGGGEGFVLRELPVKADFDFEELWKFGAEQTYTAFPAKFDDEYDVLKFDSGRN